MSEESRVSQASDPGAEPQVLYELAASNPELRPLIASNPNAYPALLEWLAQLGDAAVDAALALRAQVSEAADVSDGGAPAEVAEAAVAMDVESPSPAGAEAGENILEAEIQTEWADAEPADATDAGASDAPVSAEESQPADLGPEAELEARSGADAQALYALAISAPGLRPLIASNPNTYPGLLQWLGDLGDPAVDAALALRKQLPAAEDELGAVEISVSEEMPTDSGQVDAGVVEVAEVTTEADLDSGEAPAEEQMSAETEVIEAVPAAGIDETEVHEYQWTEEDFIAMAEGPVVQRPPEARTSAVPPSPPQWSTPGQYAGIPAATGQEPMQEKDGKAGKIAVFVLLTVLAIAAVAALVYTFLSLGSPGNNSSVPVSDEYTETEEPATEEDTEEDVVAQPEPEPEEEPEAETEEPAPIQFPAPDNAVSASRFISPSQNIACDLREDAAYCTIFIFDYASAGYPNCGERPTTIKLTEDAAALDCTATPVNPGTAEGILEYDTSATTADFACFSSDSGMSCWNVRSGSAFALARGGWVVGDNGRIPASAFTW